jgi:hypothetical protein
MPLARDPRVATAGRRARGWNDTRTASWQESKHEIKENTDYTD